uniref:Uncharacterized protein n=1 Tax=Strombidinopsis acuminata TaxID=141414 RepID=A0A7S3WKY8_9SPIT|mmetsp:Transcript_42163/g.57300  ORF Transcript_42163/g.57300 Transcript_42163/m.57300 type:complete len:105 (+) Transcript_42163:1-315(+)
MFAHAEDTQQCIHLVLQVLGFVLLFVGFHCMLSFVPTLFRVIPFLGTWIQWFGNFLATGASLLLAGCVWCLTVALAWLAMRPGKALLLLSVATLLVVLPSRLAH